MTIDSELAFHLAMREREKLSQGATPEEARRLARERFGSVTRTKEDCRERSTLPWLEAAAQDLRYACRSIAKNGRLTLAATACLGIGIGANTSVFSFVNAFLFQPLPSDVALVRRASGSPVSYPKYTEWQRHSQVFEDVFAYSPGERLAMGRDESDRALGETVSGNYFRSLGVAPALGRLLARGDESKPLAVVSHQFWKRRLLGDTAVIGKTIWIDREAFTVVGVTPPTFEGMLTPWSTDVWITPYLHRDRLKRPAGGMDSRCRAPPARGHRATGQPSHEEPGCCARARSRALTRRREILIRCDGHPHATRTRAACERPERRCCQ